MPRSVSKLASTSPRVASPNSRNPNKAVRMYMPEHRTNDAHITGCIGEESPSSLSIVCTAKDNTLGKLTIQIVVEICYQEHIEIITYHCNDKQML
jgi:hypothetical protein